MAQFNLNDYETVEQRIARFYADDSNKDARIVTINHTTPADRSTGMWVVEARIYLSRDDQADDLPKATGWAFEIDGVNGMANKTSALENCETSSIGRALANMNMSGNKRTTREEMAKVERGVTPAKPVDWAKSIAAITSVDQGRELYMSAQKSKAGQQVLDDITAKVKSLG